MHTIFDLYQYLQDLAPFQYQEDYDNSGLIVGAMDTVINGVLVSLDCTEAIIEEAISLGANIVVCHHPIVFKGFKKINGSNYVERTIIKAIKHDVAILAIHTNIDNIIAGVNHTMADKLGLINRKILVPKPNTLVKITTFVPKNDLEKVTNAMHKAGAGQIGEYKDCAFFIEGQGSFTPTGSANPSTGQLNVKSFESEIRVEMILPSHCQNAVLKALKTSHSYEEVAYYLSPLTNEDKGVGAGMVGELPQPLLTVDFLEMVKKQFDVKFIKHTAIVHETITKVGLCGGSGSFLTKNAIFSGSQAYISADFKYHEFFDAEGKILILDIGHYESEKNIIDRLFALISNNFHTFAAHYTKVDTNPVKYF
jgi:dinuclear metal center YbgI/SA1388 family protein